jgi:DNA-binding CsgD family transcriptional regulator
MVREGAAEAGRRAASPLLERESELARLTDTLRSASSSRGRLTLIEGHAGIGKSRLLAELRSRADAAVVLSAQGSPLETDFPFGVALQLVEPAIARATPAERTALLSGAAAAAKPLLEGAAAPPAGVDERLFSIVHGLFWLIANIAQREPLLVCVDDAHWVDPPSLRLVAYLAERVEDLAVSLVVAARPDMRGPARELMRRLRTLPGTTILRPAPLTPEAVETLVKVHEPAADPGFCAACAELTGGNPLLVVELLDEVQRQGLPADATASTRLQHLVPDRLADAVTARLAALPAAAQHVASASAVLGEDADLRHALAVAELHAADGLEAADALVRAGLIDDVEPDAARLRFLHPLVAAAVRERLTPVEAGRLHRRAARTLHRAGAAPERVAMHLVAAPPAAEDWAFRALLDAGARALGEGAPESAVRWLGRAVEEAPHREHRAEALAALGRAELALGRPESRRHLAEAARLEERPETRASVLLELGRAQTNAGALEEAAETLERARAELPADAPLAKEATAAWITVARHLPHLHDAARARTRELLARPRPTTHGERVLLAAASNHAAFAGEPHGRVLDLARRALDDGRLLAEETASGLSWTIAVAALGWAEDFDAVRETVEAALADARSRGSIAGFATASYARSYAALQLGRVADAAADSAQAVDLHPDPDWTLQPFACVQLAWAELERDDPDAATEALDRCSPDDRWATAPVYMLVLQARGRIALSRGQPQDALALLEEAGRRATAVEMLNPAVVPWRAPAVLACLRLGDRGRAAALAAEQLELARRFGAPRAISEALRSAGLAARGQDSLPLLTEAVDVLADSPAALERAGALVDLGGAQRRAGDRAAARATLRSGLALAQACGAVACARRADAELEAAGARPRRRELRGPGSLTPGELRVAKMAAAGMTNREIAQELFVTMKAVQYHLGNVYRKLDVPGRDDLAAALDGEGGDT